MTTSPALPSLAPFIGMTTARYTAGRPLGAPRVLVIHATAGRHPGDLAWLTRGGTAERPVSCHYYIDKAGGIVQLVRDSDTAWHCGPAAWVADGQRVEGSIGGVSRLNALSIGIELENLNNGRDPYPAAQVAAAVSLARALVTLHRIPRAQLVRHLDISPGRKTDPAGLLWGPFVEAVYAPDAGYTAHSRIISRPLGTRAQAVRWLTARATQYDGPAIATIVNAYVREGDVAGVDWFLALAQCAHETGALTSWWCARPRRNPAGIGVTGDARQGAQPGPAWAFDAEHDVWLEGCSFARWDGDAVRAHLGRLLAYALPVGHSTPIQQRLIAEALRVRGLDAAIRGRHPTIGTFGGTWAVDAGYGMRVAVLAERMRRGP